METLMSSIARTPLSDVRTSDEELIEQVNEAAKQEGERQDK